MSILSGIAYKSITMTAETATSAWPAAIDDYVRGRAFFPVLCPIHPSAQKVSSPKSVRGNSRLKVCCTFWGSQLSDIPDVFAYLQCLAESLRRRAA